MGRLIQILNMSMLPLVSVKFRSPSPSPEYDFETGQYDHKTLFISSLIFFTSMNDMYKN